MSWRLVLGAVLAMTGSVQAAPLTATITAAGSYSGSLGVAVDGVLPPLSTPYTSNQLVVWSSPDTRFTFDFGSAQAIGSVLLAVDNNDFYRLEASLDGVSYARLFSIVPSDGAVTPAQGGTDIFSSDPASAFYLPGSGFAPVTARFLRLSASGGDGIYSVGEVAAFGPAVGLPEPASLAVLGTGLPRGR